MATVPFLGGLAGGLVATIVMTGFMLVLGDDSPPPTALFCAKYVEDGRPDGYMTEGMALSVIYGTVLGGVLGAEFV